MIYHDKMKPQVITPPEWEAIAAIQDVRDAWGLDGDDEGGELLSNMVYGAKYPDYITGGPGYFGCVYVLLGDSLERPMVLKTVDGKIVVDEYSSGMES